MKFDANKQVESRFPLKPDKNTFSMTLAEIESVEVKNYEVVLIDDKGAETKSEFKGLTVPRLSITWKNHKVTEDQEERFHTLSFGPIVSIMNDGVPMTKKVLTSLYTQMNDNLMHIHNCYKKAPNYKPITSIPDIDETATAEARVKQFKAYFDSFAEAFNGKGKDAKPIFVDEKGKSIPVWLKLLAGYKDPSRHETPSFVKQGFTEIAIKLKDGSWKKPLIEVSPNESIELVAKNAKKNTSVNINTDSGGMSPELQEILNAQ